MLEQTAVKGNQQQFIAAVSLSLVILGILAFGLIAAWLLLFRWANKYSLFVPKAFADIANWSVRRKTQIFLDVPELGVGTHIGEFRIVLAESTRCRVAALPSKATLLRSAMFSEWHSLLTFFLQIVLVRVSEQRSPQGPERTPQPSPPS
jgi:hypothetical protein